MNKNSQFFSWAFLFGFLVLCLGVGGLSGYITMGGVTTWYPSLVKPFFNPPSWLFGPVWTLLYMLMAIAAWRVWRKVGIGHVALMLFFGQLVLNFFWSIIFFNMHALGLALVEIVLMWILIVATIYAFSKIDRLSAVMLAPYLAWVSFATLLNGSLWWLN